MKLIPEVKKLTIEHGFFIPNPENLLIILHGTSGSIFHCAKIIQQTIIDTYSIPVQITARLTDGDFGIHLYEGQNLNSEKYDLLISEKIIELKGESSQALFYAVQTLRQIFMQSKQKIPCLKISDFADFSMRGFYHDVTRGKVPTLKTLKELVDKLAFYKLNQLQLYIEHTFAFSKIPELWFDKDPLTADEILELDQYCKLNHVELIPSLATFGHLYELLRIKRFEHLNELDIKASEIPYCFHDRMMHYTVDVSQDESFELVRSMIEEYLPLFSSKYFNICGDETVDLGKGKNKQKADTLTSGRLYVDFLNKLISVVKENGKTAMFWGDIVTHWPNLFQEIPKDTIFLNWDYSPNVLDTVTKQFSQAGVSQVVCPGTLGWSRFANNINDASMNISKMVAHGKKYNAIGVLTTDWGDCGHVNFLSSSIHGLALGAALSWNADSFSDFHEFDTTLSQIEWGDPEIADHLRQLGSLCPYGFNHMYTWTTQKQNNWFIESKIEALDNKKVIENYEHADKIYQFFLSKIRESNSPKIDFKEFVLSSRLIRWSLALIVVKKKFEFKQEISLPLSKAELISEGYAILSEFKNLWRFRNKESELYKIVDVFGNILNKVESF